MCSEHSTILHAMPVVAHCKLQGRAPLVNVQASPWDPTLSSPEYRVQRYGPPRACSQRLRHSNPSRTGDWSRQSHGPWQQSPHVTAHPSFLEVHSTFHPVVRSMGRSMGRTSSRCDPGGTALPRPRWCWPLVDELRRRQAPLRSESEAHSYGTAHDVLYSHRNRLQQSPLTRERLPRPAHRVAFMFLFWTALLMHAAQNCSHLPPTRAFGFGMPNQHGGLPIDHLAPCARLSFLSQDSTAPRESVRQNTVSGSARVETVLISAVLPRHRPS